jgi:hypothetical protein
MHTAGKGKYQVWLEKKHLGDDLLLILGGGEKPHLGAIIICESKKPTQVVKMQGHYDHIVIQPLAEKACKKYHTRVIAVGGVHIDNASKKDIKILVENCKELETCI